jgi:hypothetical protein
MMSYQWIATEEACASTELFNLHRRMPGSMS